MKGGIVIVHKYQTEVAGRPLIIEVGQVAKQANGSAVVRYGQTVVLVTATASKEPREGIDFFPLTVDYEEKQYAAGKIPGGFIKREGRATENATLSARLIDRPIRPLFPKGFKNDIHVVATILSVEKDNTPDVTAIIGASVALNVSNIPFAEPITAVVVGMIDGQLIINPTLEQLRLTDIHMTVAGTKEAIMMVEGSGNEVPEDTILDAVLFGHEEIKKIIAFQEPIIAEIGTSKMEVVTIQTEEIDKVVREYAMPILEVAVKDPEKKMREAQMDSATAAIKNHFAEIYPEELKQVSKIIEKTLKETVRNMILRDGDRVDGRKLDEIRSISCEIGFLPRPHGSGLFTRGQTQVLSVTTLGAASEEQRLDGLGVEDTKRYIHHYNFPPFSVGETRPMRGPGRREIGHGALAERALLAVLPSEQEFPYTIRVVSEVLESNGSSSMGSVCGSTLSLMHAGVPIKAPVSGIAMGLVKGQGNEFAILSDIQGIEDALGDMDFKLAGTTKGVTAIQMDIKIVGVNKEIIKTALDKARTGRLFIMDKMLEVISEPRTELSPYAPQLTRMQIPPDKIREVIGPGGKVIHKIVDETGCKIDIEDDGTLFIITNDQEAAQKAKFLIESIIAEVEVGKTYMGKVKRIMEFGAFVEIIPGVLGSSGKEGLVHISQLAEDRVNKVKDVVDIGDEILVKVLEIDKQGRVNLSRKAALKNT